MARRREPLINEELKLIFNSCSDPELRAIMATLLVTGCRISEVLQMKFKDIWKEGENIFFHQYVLKYKKKIVPEITRVVPANNPFLPFLFAWYNHGGEAPREDLIFTKCRQSVWREVARLLPGLHPHLFRSTLATRLGEENDAFTLQAWFKWSDLNLCSVYVRRSDAMIRATQTINKALCVDSVKTTPHQPS